MKSISNTKSAERFRAFFLNRRIAEPVILVLTAIAQFSSAQNVSAEESNTLVSPKEIQGKVINADELPIESAIVTVEVIAEEPFGKQRSRQLLRTIVKTNEKGVFTAAVSKTAPMGHEISVYVSARSEHCFPIRDMYVVAKEDDEIVRFKPLKLHRGVKVTGQVVAPKSSSDRLQDPTVGIYATYESTDGGYSNLFQDLECDSDGRFEAIVPEECDLTLSAFALNFATVDKTWKLQPQVRTRTESEIEVRELGEVVLKSGVTVSGVARKLDGRPAAGVVFAMIEESSMKTDGISGEVWSAKTDAKGQFQFYPATGRCKIFSVPACRNRKLVDGERRILVAVDNETMFDHPVIDLDGKGARFEIELTEIESLGLSGVVEDRNGKPLAGVGIFSGWKIGAFTLDHTFLKTDQRGRYSIRFPKNRVPWMMVNDYHRTSDFWVAYLKNADASASYRVFVDPYAEQGQSSRSQKFRRLTEDVSGLNWVMQPEKTRVESALSRVGRAAKWLFLGDE